MRRDNGFHDDLLAWLSPGGLLLTALMLRFPEGLRALRAVAPELTLPTWFAGACVLGVALSPVGRLAYGLSQAIVWPLLREAWAPAIRFLAARPERSGGWRRAIPRAWATANSMMSTAVCASTSKRSIRRRAAPCTG